jgi:DNA-binding NarL/FixJ family response regulator
MISVFIVDTNTTFLNIAAGILKDYYNQEITVIGTATTYHDALQQLPSLHPHVVLLGIGQYDLGGLTIICNIRTMLPGVGVIVLGALDTQAYQQAALHAGADMFVPKVALNRELLNAIRRIFNRPHGGTACSSDYTVYSSPGRTS